MSQRQNTTKGNGPQKKGPNRQNNSFKSGTAQNSRRQMGNARNEGISGQNLGGLGAMRTAPIAMSKTIKTGVPKMTTLRNGDCRIVHREYIQDIVAASTGANFNNTQVSINPGQASFVPWLSKIAQNFESYRFSKLKFDYETEAPSSLGGTLVLAVDYDASDAAPLTKQQALAYRGSVRSAPWTPCQHRSVKEDLEKQKSYFVRPGAQPANTDIRLWDVGVLNVATQGITVNSGTCGELYVEYDVLLMTPIYESLPASSTVTSFSPTIGNPMNNGVPAGLLISSFLPSGTLNLQNLIVNQEYIFTYLQVGGGPAAVNSNPPSVTGLTLKSTLSNDGATTAWTYTATASQAVLVFTLTGTAPTSAIAIFAQLPTSGL
jgi:hypothetical protein